MKRFKYIFGFWLLLFMACQEAPRLYPVSYDQEQEGFLQFSKKKNRQLIEVQSRFIEDYIKKNDSLNFRKESAGFYISLINKNITQDVLPKEGDQIKYSYSVYDLSDELLYSYDDTGVIEEVLGKSEVKLGLYHAIQVIKPGQEALLIFPSAVAYGFSGDGDKIAPAQPIKMRLKLMEVKRDNQ